MTQLLEQQPSRRAATPSSTSRAVPSYELVGPADAPVIVALGGISATRHTILWWSDIVGDGKAIDTQRYRVLGIDFLDGGRRSDGRPRRTITTHDQADAIVDVLDHLHIGRVHCFVGASYGGMVALAFAERYPERVERLVVVSAPHEPHPMSTALRALQRRIVKLGLETGRTRSALAIARGLAMTTYRSREEFGERFESTPVALHDNDATFPVESYLEHHGERFADRWSAERFLALSLSGDLHRIDPRRVVTPTVIVAADGDAIVPGEQLEELAATLAAPTRLLHLPSKHGHDAFLTEADALGRILEIAIATTIVQ
jgi:homoserine O-acetyltransferase